jgi:hypothetical protein
MPSVVLVFQLRAIDKRKLRQKNRKTIRSTFGAITTVD